MREILLHSETCGELLLLPEIPALLVRWHGFANSANLRQLLDQGLAFYRRHASRYVRLGWLSDTRHFGAVLPADQRWLSHDWNQRAWAAGIRHVAFLTPETIFGQIAVQHYTLATLASPDYQLQVSRHASVEDAVRGRLLSS